MNARHDEGAAALELALCLGTMLTLVAVVAPLGLALLERTRLERAAGQTARFAAAAPNRPRYGVTGPGRRPTKSDVQAEAVRAFTATGSTPTFTAASVEVYTLSGGTKVDAVPYPDRPGTQIHVSMSQDFSLGPLGGFLDALGVIDNSTIQITATAVAREE